LFVASVLLAVIVIYCVALSYFS